MALPLSLPVHHGQGGLTAAAADGRSNRQLLDAAPGFRKDVTPLVSTSGGMRT